MAVDIQRVADLLGASVNANQRHQAELSLREEETKPGFSLVLLQLVANETKFDAGVRLSGAIFFKNFIRRNWTNENGDHKLPRDEVGAIKSELIGLMVKVRPAIQVQLGDAISLIADSDFWQRWETLVDDLVSRLTPKDAVVNIGVLEVAHSIFKRWEPLYRSDELYTEINHVLERFAAPLLTLWANTDRAIEESQDDKKQLEAHYKTLELIIRLVYDLSTHDMPPQFEAHLDTITPLLQKYLTSEPPALRSEDDSEPSPVDLVRVSVFAVLIQYTKKYEEEVDQKFTPFIVISWNLLTTLGPESGHDTVVSKALEYLTTVAGIRKHAENFNNADVLGQITERVVIPNLALRESDIEIFEDEPIEFIRRDLEGSDEDTRRRAAVNFLKKLIEQFEKLVTDVVSRYVAHYLSEYAKDHSNKWKDKDTAVHLFSAISAKGASTSAKGVLSVNPSVDVIDFFQKHIAEDLINPSAHPLLKVDAIKYLYTFRSILSADQWQAAFPLLVQHLNFSNYVVYTYAAIAVDRALYLTNEQRQPIIPRESIVQLAKDLLQHLFKLITKDSTPEQVQENEFLMKCVMRVVIVIRENVTAVSDLVLTNLVNITKVIRHNPSNPAFCYYHFESLGALVRFAGPTQPEKIESTLFPVFMQVLQSQTEEFMPYIFQLYAQMVATNPANTLSPNFQQLITPLLVPDLWDSRGNVPALTRLLVNLLPHGATTIAASNQTEALLVIFQKLVSSKAYETHAMDLIEAIVTSFPSTALETFWPSILQIMFTRLATSKTETFTLRFVRFYYLVAARSDRGLGADFFIQVADAVQANVFTPIYINIILPDTQKLSRPFDRKTACIALTRTVADSRAFAERYAKRGWALTCEALLKLLINPPLPAGSDDAIEDRDVDDVSFGAAFTPLSTCKRALPDPWPEVQDVKAWVGLTLRDADRRHAGRIAQFVGEKLDAQGQAALQLVMQG